MKRRWVCQLLDEAPLPPLVLVFAVSQSRLGADPKLREPLACRRPSAAVQVAKGSQRSLDSQGSLNEPCRSTIPEEAIFGSSWPKGNQLGHQWRGKKQ